MPTDFFKERSRRKEIITLSDIVGDSSSFLTLVALFRFIDGIDINKNRVGDYNERDHKAAVIGRDKKYQLKRIKKEVDIILHQLSGNKIESDVTRLSFRKQFYDEIVEKINRAEFAISPELLEYASENIEAFEDYFVTANYASFISVQDGHFDLHSSIKEVKIKHPDKTNPEEIEIHYYSDRTREYLQGMKIVRDLGEKDLKTIAHHIIGAEEANWEDGYVLKELKAGGKWLKDLFNVKGVYLHSSDNKKIGWKEENGKRMGLPRQEQETNA